MYNSQNLPLNKKKIIKKALPSILLLVIITITCLGAFIFSFYNGVPWVAAIVLFRIWLFILILSLPQVIYQYLYYKYYYYNFQEDEAEIRKGVVSRATGHVQYRKIQNIFLDKDVMDRIFGLYDVHYETAGLTSGFYSHVDGLTRENAEKLVGFLKKHVRDPENKTFASHESAERTERILPDKDIPDDGTRYSRDNLPIEKKVIWAEVLPSTITWTIFAFIFMKTLTNVGLLGISLAASFLLPPLITLIATYFYWFIWYRNFNYWFEKDGGEVTSKVLSANQTHLYFDRIQNVNISQSFIQRLFELYVVSIETAAEGSALLSLVIPGLNQKNAETLKNYLLSKSKKYRDL